MDVGKNSPKLEINYYVSKTCEENNFVIVFVGYSLIMSYRVIQKMDSNS
jgi:hypothetical protein